MSLLPYGSCKSCLGMHDATVQRSGGEGRAGGGGIADGPNFTDGDGAVVEMREFGQMVFGRRA
jgi:hypothetical protein